MGEVADIVKIYIDQSDILEDKTKEISNSLQTNIRSNLWKGNGYNTGQLSRDISSNYAISGKAGVVVGWYTVDYGKYVDQGTRPVTGKLMKMPWGYRRSRKGTSGIQFMKKGLEKTLEMYK